MVSKISAMRSISKVTSSKSFGKIILIKDNFPYFLTKAFEQWLFLIYDY